MDLKDWLEVLEEMLDWRWHMVVYMCSSLLELAPGSRDLSQA